MTPEKRYWRSIAALIGCLALAVVVAVIAGSEKAPPATSAPAVEQTPAALPQGTGVDGEGVVAGVDDLQPDGLPADPEQLPADVQTQPEAGAPAVVVETDEGIGGEVYVSSPAWKGKQRLNAGFRYPSGSLHAAWDVGIKRGTKVYAAKAATVVGRNDGVKNHPSGSQYAVSGSPSNWVLICSTVRGKPAVLYYQHLSPGLAVKRGQKVAAGQYLGKSGNTGNSTGDHLHISSSFSPWGCSKITAARAEWLRYDYLRKASTRIFAPSVFWAAAKAKPVVDASKTRKACTSSARYAQIPRVRKAVGGASASTACGPVLRKRYASFQRSLGYRGKAANGVPGLASLKVLGKRNGWRVVA